MRVHRIFRSPPRYTEDISPIYQISQLCAPNQEMSGRNQYFNRRLITLDGKYKVYRSKPLYRLAPSTLYHNLRSCLLYNVRLDFWAWTLHYSYSTWRGPDSTAGMTRTNVRRRKLDVRPGYLIGVRWICPSTYLPCKMIGHPVWLILFDYQRRTQRGSWTRPSQRVPGKAR